MKFPLFKKKKESSKSRPVYVNMRPRIDNSNILAQAKKRKQKQLLTKRAEFISPQIKSLPLPKILLTFALLVLLIGAFLFLRSTTIFDVKDVEVITDKSESYSIVKEIADKYISKNIIFISSSEIESSIKSKLPSVHTVFVNKTLDGKLKVEIIEDAPVYYEANNSGIYLINQSGGVMEVIEPETKLTFSETELLLRDNKLPADSDQVRIKYLDGYSEEERSKIIWKDVEREEKEAVLNQMKQDLDNKINDFTNKLAEQLKEDRYKNLIGSYIPNNENYSVGDEVPLERLNFVSIVLDFFKSKNLNSTKVVWDSDYSLEVFLQDNPSVLLSVKRSYSSQFIDLNTLIYYGQFNGARVVDVRSNNYSVVR